VAGLLTLLTPWMARAAEKRLLYVGRAPKDRDGFRTLKPSLEVFDIDNGHKRVKTIPLVAPPGTAPVFNIRGITASAATRKLYITHYGSYKELHRGGPTSGHVLCLDLETEKVLWNRPYAASVDRGAVTPDGAKLFMPSGELAATPYFYIIDGASGEEKAEQRIPVAPYTHNTVVTLDGSRVFMTAFGAFGDGRYEPYIRVADTQSGKVVQKVGPFAAHVRPITINGAGSLVFACVNKLIGFQVGDVRSGKVLYTAQAPVEKFPSVERNVVVSHGISMTADEKEVWVVDQVRGGVHVFDVSGLPESAPVWKTYIDTHGGREKDDKGQFLYGETGIFGQPGWIMSSLDGKYFYLETGEILDTAAKKVVGQLIGANGKYLHSRFALEVVFDDDKLVRVGDQQGVGRKTREP
jgi:DNA-binding beta-propeller fold protein YncE